MEEIGRSISVTRLDHTECGAYDSEGRLISFKHLFDQHRLKTISYCAVFWSFGMCVAFLGPTLLDLECKIGTVFSSMSWIFFSQSLFNLIGAACAGFTVQRIGSSMILLISTTMLSVTLALMPYCTALTLLLVVLAVMGFFMGAIDTVANISMIELYGRNVAPFLQTLHFFYGLGAFLAPMVAEPFLMNDGCPHKDLNHRIPRSLIQNLGTNTTKNSKDNSEVEDAFWILSAMQVPVVCLMFVLVIRDLLKSRKVSNIPTLAFNVNSETIEVKYPDSQSTASSEFKMHDDRHHVTTVQIILITTFTALLLFLYDGFQASYGGYVFSSAVRSIAGMSRTEAAYLNACFWGTFALGRLISIGLATRLKPSFMLSCNIIGSLFAVALMLAFRHDHTILYIGTCILGIFMSSVYPTAMSLAEKNIRITSVITSVLVGGGAMGEMAMPVIIGHAFEAFGPVSLLISGVTVTIVSGIIYISEFAVIRVFARQF